MKYAYEQKEKVAGVLRKYIGRHGVAVAHASRETGMAVATIHSHLRAITGPNCGQLFAYVELLGADFVNDLFSQFGFTVSWHRAKDSDGDYNKVLADLTEGAAVTADALRDGYVDHLERASILSIWGRVQSSLGLGRAAHCGRGQ